MNGARKSVRLFGENLEEGMHIFSYVRSAIQRSSVTIVQTCALPNQGDRALHIVNPSLRSEHTQRIAEAGIDAERAEVDGRSEERRVGKEWRGGRSKQSERV